MQRATRAQRAAIGDAAVRANNAPPRFTPAQHERLARLKADFGVKWVHPPQYMPYTGHMMVPMSNAIAKVWLIFDDDGKYVTRYNQTQPLFEGTHADAT